MVLLLYGKGIAADTVRHRCGTKAWCNVRKRVFNIVYIYGFLTRGES